MLVALAYPDRVARRKADGRYLLRNGRTARIDGADPLAREEWLAVADLDGSSSELRIAIAAPISQNVLERMFADQITSRTEAGWSERDKRIVARSARVLGAIVIDQRDDPQADRHDLACAFARFLAEREFRDLPWTDEARQFIDRVRFSHGFDPDTVPDLRDEDLAATAEEWLAPSLLGRRTMADVAKIDLEAALRSALPSNAVRRVDAVAPAVYRPPKGREVPIDYSVPDRPSVAVRLQFMFGVKRQPTIAMGNVPLTIELLSPAGRPIQVTRDLAGFWSGSYAQVRKEMKGRYPKHDWPENP
jgi:ATP-dependent helicase HrpB